MDGGTEAEGSGGLLGTPAALTSWKLPSLVLGGGTQSFCSHSLSQFFLVQTVFDNTRDKKERSQKTAWGQELGQRGKPSSRSGLQPQPRHCYELESKAAAWHLGHPGSCTLVRIHAAQ